MNAPAIADLHRLDSIVGGANVLTAAVLLADYEVDGLRPAAVVRPGSAEEIAEVVRFAAAEKLAVIPMGARTKLRIGAPPERYDLALDMTRLDRVLAYDPGDLTLGVEPGLPLARLATVLGEHKQVLPLAVPFTKRTTAGGAIASGVDSPLRQFYGTARDYVLGMEFVTGEGKLAKSGGRVVKNVTGYDLHKPLIGSLGTLAVITRVNFRTFPLAPASRGFLAAFPSAKGALELRARIVRSPLSPLTLEILSPQVALIFRRLTPQAFEPLPPPADWLSTAEWTLAAGFGGEDAVLERQARELTRMAELARATSAVILSDEDRPKVWRRLREFIPLMLQASPAATIIKISALPTQLGAILTEAQRVAERCQLPCATLARAVGIVYAAYLPAAKDERTLAMLAEAANDMVEASAKLDARSVLQWCPTELKRRVNLWGASHGDLALMQRLKHVFDPQGVLSPGRFVGGI